MRGTPPFLEDHLTAEVIERLAATRGTLMIYCGAGVTIDRTGHTWQSLLRALLPERRTVKHAALPTRAEFDRLNRDSPEPLASSIIHLLREASGGGKHLQRTLRERLQTALYGSQSAWRVGDLVEQITTLAVARGYSGLRTRIFTTNYDTHLERFWEVLHTTLDDSMPLPGYLFIEETLKARCASLPRVDSTQALPAKSLRSSIPTDVSPRSAKVALVGPLFLTKTVMQARLKASKVS